MPALPRTDSIPVCADDIKSRWRRGESPDTAAILREYPSLARHKSVVVDLAYEEYCLREEAGEAPDAERFCERFGAFRGSLRKVLDAHRLLADHPELLGPPVEWPTAGATVEGLELIRELGRGAFGRAYLAFDPETNRPCVLKLAAGRSAEARVVGPLDHPNVTDVYWSRPVGGLTAVCMPLVGVTTLEDVRDAAFPTSGAAAPPRAEIILNTIEPVGRADDPVIRPGERYAVGVAAVAAGIADALRYLHARGVAHGDLKPSNVVLGAGGRPHLIDFNLAVTKDAPHAAAGGTLPYMAPEQLRVLAGQAPPSEVIPERADLYAFGAMLFELLTGRLPCEPAGPDEPRTVAADLLARRLREPCDERSFPPETPARLVRVVLRCLAPAPAARPADAATVAAELAALLRTLRGHRRRGLVAAAACGVVALAGASWFALPEKPPPAPPITRAEAEPTTADEFFARGLRYLHAGQYPQALSDFTTANHQKRDPRAQAYSAYCHELMGQSRAAVQKGIEATQGAPHAATVYNNLGFSQNRMLQHTEAIAYLDKAIEHDPNLREAYYNRAFAQHQIDMRKSKNAPDLRAVQDIRKALQGGPASAEIYHLAADICVHAAIHDPGLYDRAMEYVAEAIRYGIPLRKIQRDLVLKRGIGDNPKFQQLLMMPQQAKEQMDPYFGLVEPVLP
jgi:serine/threonine protein kinase